MTSTGSHNSAPEPQKPPQHTGRVLCILSGPAFSAAQRHSLPAQASTGQGWMVMRQRWTIKV
jgi:hypothetical protein